MRNKKRKSLTPFLDEVDVRKKMFLPDIENMPIPTELDMYFLEVAEKHGIDLMEADFSDYGEDGEP